MARDELKRIGLRGMDAALKSRPKMFSKGHTLQSRKSVLPSDIGQSARDKLFPNGP